MSLIAVGLSALLWVAVLALPWRPWSTRERLDIGADAPSRDLSDITVLMPARNEVACIAETLRRLDAQGLFNRIVVIDDQSDDGTKEAATELNLTNLLIIDGAPPPAGWSGKLWALHQGLQHAESKYVLLLDADIGLASGTISVLLEHLEAHKLDMASLMANLHMRQFWEKLLLPPFVYFFKMIYPFALANSPNSRIAAGAGGCVLIATTKLQQIGGFSALKGAIIDDCTLARKIKDLPSRIWIGLSNDACALRPYTNLPNIWNMVARTAFTQLRYSPVLLVACTGLLIVSYVVPLIGIFSSIGAIQSLSAIALAAMFATYWPIVKFYNLSFFWTFTLPLAAILFLAMTWTSALRYWRGERSRWKNRSYLRADDDGLDIEK